jgi:hypothetical protein
MLLATCLSARRTMINGSALCAARAVTEHDELHRGGPAVVPSRSHD